MLRAAAWLLLVAVTVNAQLPVGVKHDPCDSHEPTASNQLGCVWGPVGDKLELPQCNYDGEHGLAKRLVEGVEGITAAQKTIQVRPASRCSSSLTHGKGGSWVVLSE
jgi:hypothetical protein